MKVKRLLTFLLVALSITLGVAIPTTSFADTASTTESVQAKIEGEVAEATPQYTNSWVTDIYGNAMYNNLSTHYTKAGSRDGSAIDTISIHCMIAVWTGKRCADYFSNETLGTYASSQYCVGWDGSVAQAVSEAYRSYCTSSYSNDIRAVTIETASEMSYPYEVTDEAIDMLVKLCVDICERNEIKQLLWQNDEDLIGNVAKQNMTVHMWFANKDCPGPYLLDKHYEIADRVNYVLAGGTDPGTGWTSSGNPATKGPIQVVTPDDAVDVENYVVKTTSSLRVRTGPGTTYEQQLDTTGAKVAVDEGNLYTICWEYTDSDGLVWGRLSDATGWICLSYTEKVENATPDEEVIIHEFAAGDVVSVNEGAVWYNTTKTPADFVFEHNWIIKSISGDRAVLGDSADGERSDISSPISTTYLTWVPPTTDGDTGSGDSGTTTPPEEGGETGGDTGSGDSGTTTPPAEFEPYTVKVNVANLEIYEGPGTNYAKTGTIITDMGRYTIVEESAGEGSTNGWGKLKSGAGWINLDDVISSKPVVTPPTTDGDTGSGDSGTTTPPEEGGETGGDTGSGDSGTTPPPSAPVINEDIVIGVIVKIKTGANYYGKSTMIPSWITNKNWVVKDVIGDKVVIDKATDGSREGRIEVKSTDVELASSATIVAIVQFESFTVEVSQRVMLHIGAGENFIKSSIVKKGDKFVIVAVAQGQGSMSGWGKLENGKWISLDVCEKVA